MELKDFIPEKFDINSNSYFLFEINNQLYRVGNNSDELFKEYNEYLKSHNVSLKELLNEEYQKNIDNNILISNIFNDLKDFFEYSLEDLYEKVSKTERLLLTSPSYKNMTVDSKFNYRRQLVKLAKKNHMSEYQYLEKIFNPEEHIGFQLFKEPNSSLRMVFYLIFLTLLTFGSSYFLSAYL